MQTVRNGVGRFKNERISVLNEVFTCIDTITIKREENLQKNRQRFCFTKKLYLQELVRVFIYENYFLSKPEKLNYTNVA